MTIQATQVLADALQLSEKERALIAHELLATLSPDVPDLEDDELEAELDRRLDEYRRDPTIGTEWSQIRGQQST
jgi:putative addiction module component (TIGR02574 family)